MRNANHIINALDGGKWPFHNFALRFVDVQDKMHLKERDNASSWGDLINYIYTLKWPAYMTKPKGIALIIH